MITDRRRAPTPTQSLDLLLIKKKWQKDIGIEKTHTHPTLYFLKVHIYTHRMNEWEKIFQIVLPWWGWAGAEGDYQGGC